MTKPQVNENPNRTIADWGGNILALLVTITINGLANSMPLGGQTTGEISDKYPSLFTPAGYVFSIWGLIYVGLAIFIIWQALPRQRGNRNLAAIRFPFVTSCVANSLWIFAWHYGLLVLSLFLMFILLGALTRIYRSLNIGLSNEPVLERWILHLPFSIYTGWVTIAMIANMSALQIDQGWNDLGLDAPTWTIIKITIAAAIAATVLLRRHDVAFILVTVWACTGIAIKQQATPIVSGASSVIAIFGLLLIASVLLARARYRRK